MTAGAVIEEWGIYIVSVAEKQAYNAPHSCIIFGIYPPGLCLSNEL